MTFILGKGVYRTDDGMVVILLFVSSECQRVCPSPVTASHRLSQRWCTYAVVCDTVSTVYAVAIGKPSFGNVGPLIVGCAVSFLHSSQPYNLPAVQPGSAEPVYRGVGILSLCHSDMSQCCAVGMRDICRAVHNGIIEPS